MNIRNSPSGKVIRLSTGYSAFIPNPLPPDFEWTQPLAHALSRANFLLGKLSKEGSNLPNPHMLIRPFITREAVLSSRIEGTQTTLGEILAVDAGAQVAHNLADLQEVRNYIVALDYGLKRLDTLPFSLRLIKELHSKLMDGVRGNHATPGEFRHSQNWIGSPGCTLATAKYVPPPPAELMNCLGNLEIFLHDKQMPLLVHIALCHYQFEAIHPFLDGNGRVGRLLITLLLIEKKLLPSPLLYLSAFFEATRNDYYRQLYSVSSHGTWSDWLIYFLNGVAIQSEDALSRVERINKRIAQWETEVEKEGSKILLAMIHHFAANPYLTVKKVAKDLNCSYSTAQRGISKLESLKIIEQIHDHKRNKIYCSIDIFNILEEPTKIHSDYDS